MRARRLQNCASHNAYGASTGVWWVMSPVSRDGAVTLRGPALPRFACYLTCVTSFCESCQAATCFSASSLETPYAS